jgi:hypothetical protein
MNTALCTLFDGDYHLGAAALVNSLHHHGFKGTVWMGCRGALPPWAATTARESWHEWSPADGLVLRFVPLTTTAHLTNHKPAFMQDLWTRFCPEADALFYFDPDIVVKCRWSFFDDWVSHGVALVEDVNSPIPESHPRRAAWKRSLARRGMGIRREIGAYVNGGFVGIARAQRGFLDAWVEAMALVGEEVGGLEHSMFSFRPELASESYPYSKTDQDALNIAVMTAQDAVSIMGREAMDFREGGWTMSHALGRKKPWHGGFIRQALKGYPPSMAAKTFYNHISAPIPIFLPARARWLRMTLKIGALIGRFYRRT